MTNDPLTTLLTRADIPAPPPATDERTLAASIRSRAARRSMARRASAVSLAALIIMSLVLFTHRATPPVPTAPPIDVARIRAELASLNSEARLHEMTARAVEQADTAGRRTAAAARILASAASDDVQQHRESAAAVLVYQAQKLVLEPATKPDALIELRSAATLFPETAAGRRAGEFLNHGT